MRFQECQVCGEDVFEKETDFIGTGKYAHRYQSATARHGVWSPRDADRQITVAATGSQVGK